MTNRRGDIQGLRGIAVLLVVIFHAEHISGGFIGVDAFFVISGFVITALILRELVETGSLSLVRFYSRRARRILPALAVLLIAVAIGSAVVLSPLGSQQVASRTSIASSLFAANLSLLRTVAGYFDAPAQLNPLLHTWSLSVEEQFYVFFPVLLLLTWRVGSAKNQQKRFVGVLAALTVVSFSLCVVVSLDHLKIAFYSSPTRAWEFGLGALIAALVPSIRRISESVAIALGAVGLAVLIGTGVWLTEGAAFPGWIAAIPVVATALVIVAGSRTDRGATRLLSVGPLQWIGDVSYGWYLWHWPAIVFARVLWPDSSWAISIAAAASLLPTWLSYRLVEHPLRINQKLVGRRVLPLTAIAILVPCLVAAGLYASTRPRFLPSSVRDVTAQWASHADNRRGCDKGRTGTGVVPRCSWDVPGGADRVVLVGDSNAGQFTEPVQRAANLSGMNFTVSTARGCPFAFVTAVFEGLSGAACRAYVERTVAELVTTHASVVVIATASSGYLRNNDMKFLSANGDFTADLEAKSALWTEGVRSVVNQLQAGGVRVLLVHTVPYLPPFDFRVCPAFRLITGAQACGASISRRAADVYRSVAVKAEETAIADQPMVAGFDLADDICTVTCVSNIGDRWLYRDRSHLTVGESLRLAPKFTDAIANLVR